jgi:methionyl-tRNA synthetase
MGPSTDARPSRRRPRTVLVTATPPTPNGDLHLGHLSGPYLAGDVYTRYLRLRGVEAWYLSGIDDNQSYVTVKGRQLGRSSADTAAEFGDRMAATLAGCSIELDHLARPDRSTRHVRQTQEMFADLHRRGVLEVREERHLHCETCARYVFEAFVSGACPHCRNSTGGNLCEACGRPNDCADLIDPICVLCGDPPTLRRASRLYLPLSRYARELEDHVKSARMSPHLRVVCEEMLAAGLPDVSMSHFSEWGIPVPVPGFEGQTIYVWFEMAPGFLAATEELAQERGAESWQTFWGPGADPESEVVQFFGIDNGFFYALLFPAIFLAWNSEVRLPTELVVNEFYRLEGSKFSTSRGHAIWGADVLRRLMPDQVRFYMAYTSPQRTETNFEQEACDRALESELRGAWQGWLFELGRRASADLGGRAPRGTLLDPTHVAFAQRLQELVRMAETAYEAETFSPQSAARACCELVRLSREHGDEQSHWQRVAGCRERWEASMALELLAAKTLALISYPLMPHFATRLWRELGFHSTIDGGRWEETPEWVPPEQTLFFDPEPYFPHQIEPRGTASGSRPEPRAASAERAAFG